jgi:hypothetical protein
MDVCVSVCVCVCVCVQDEFRNMQTVDTIPEVRSTCKHKQWTDETAFVGQDAPSSWAISRRIRLLKQPLLLGLPRWRRNILWAVSVRFTHRTKLEPRLLLVCLGLSALRRVAGNVTWVVEVKSKKRNRARCVCMYEIHAALLTSLGRAVLSSDAAAR